MNAPAVVTIEHGQLCRALDSARKAIADAATAAEVLDARDQADFVYSAANQAARLARAKAAHADVIAGCYRVEADALEAIALADRKLADEYDAAQARGDMASHGGHRSNRHAEPSATKIPDGNLATLREAGLKPKQVFEARQIRDVIEREPGIVRAALDEMLKAGDEPTKARLKHVLMPAITTIRAEQTAAKKERRAEREIELTKKIRALPDKRYGVILEDPEWQFEPYSRDTGMDRAADNHYPTSPTSVIAARDVASIAAADCVLFLWATAPMLEDALEVMKARGFAYKTHAIWLKQRSGDGRGSGYWFLGEHELLLVGTRGNVPAPAMGTQWRSIIIAPVGAHSEKPGLVLELIEAYFPNLPKIELNRRGPPRPGWDSWGNETEVREDHPSPTPAKGSQACPACVSSPTGGEVEADGAPQSPTSPPVGEDSKSGRAEGEGLDALGEGYQP